MTLTPNAVSLVNNSNVTMTGAILCHSTGMPVIIGPTEFSLVLQFTNLAAGATYGPGSTQVADGLADYWGIAAEFADNPGAYMFLLGALDTEPYKKCNSPDNGSTQFVISPSNGTAYPVTINTIHSDGSSDGSCSSALAPITDIQSDPLADLLLHYLLDALGG